MANKTIHYKLSLDTSNSIKNIAGVENKLEELRSKISTEDFGTAKFKALAKEISGLETKLKNADLAMEGIDSEQAISEFAGLAGGISEAIGGLALLGGTGNETMEELVASTQRVIGVVMGLKGAMEALKAAPKVIKAINAAMAANPAMILVTAIVALTAAFAGLMSSAHDTAEGLKEYKENNEDVNENIDIAIVTFEALGDVWDSIITTLGYLTAEQEKYNQSLLDNIDSAYKVKQKEIELAKARGASTEEIIKQRRKQLKEERVNLQKLLDQYKINGDKWNDEQKKQLEERVNNFKEHAFDLQKTIAAYNKKQKDEEKKNYEKTLKEREAFEKEMRTFGLHGMELELENERIWYEKKLKEFKKFGGDIELLNREHYLRMADISSKYLKNETIKIIEWKDEYDKLLQDDEEDKYMIVDEAMKKRGEMELLNLQEQKQLEKDMLIENWDWTVLGTEELNAKLAEIDQKYADEEYQRKLDNTNKNIDLVGGFFSTSLQAAELFGVKSREIQKAQALVDISINTAKAIAFAVAGATKSSLTPVDFAIQLASYIGAIIASMAKAKQAFAKAADGGLIYGNSHANGGVIIEAEGGEAIINKKSTAMFAPQLSAINQAMGGKPIGNQTGQLIDYDLLASKINDKRVILVASDVTNQQATDVKVKSTAKL